MRPLLHHKLMLILDKIFPLAKLNNLELLYTKRTEFPVAEPKTPLKIKKIVQNSNLYIPSSLGIDGYVYGVVRDSNTIWRSNDGMATVENFEHDFHSNGFWYPYWATKTHSGFVVITGNRYGDGNPNTGAVFFAQDFNGQYELKNVFTENHTPSEFGITYHHGIAKSEQIILIAERGFPVNSEERGKIRATFDGGQTWNIICEYGEIINPSANTHFHTAVYDPYRGRLWVSKGDGDNAKTLISDNLGQSWRKVDFISDHTPCNQPTMLLPLANNIIYGSDGGRSKVGIWKILVDKYFGTESERFYLEKGAFCWDEQSTIKNYPISSYAVDGNIAYISLPSGKYDNGRSFVIATGDGGNTWHTVAGYHYSKVLDRGIIGPDKNGNLYGIWDTLDEPNTTAIFDSIAWQYK